MKLFKIIAYWLCIYSILNFTEILSFNTIKIQSIFNFLLKHIDINTKYLYTIFTTDDLEDFISNFFTFF